MWLYASAALALPDPAWVEPAVAAFVALPSDGRIDGLQGMVAQEADDERKSALIALGRLAQRWPSDVGPEALAVYAREVLTAPDAGRRSYVIAAAGFGAAIGPDGLPTMTTDQAKSLYADRRYALGVVVWNACAPVMTTAFARAEGYWVRGELAPYREARKPSRVVRSVLLGDENPCRQGYIPVHSTLGWTVFEGASPVQDPRELGSRPPGKCETVTLRVLDTVYQNGMNGWTVETVDLPPRVQDCGTLAEWEGVAAELDARLLADLRLQPQDVADLVGSPSTLEGFRPCEAKHPTEETAALCAIR